MVHLSNEETYNILRASILSIRVGILMLRSPRRGRYRIALLVIASTLMAVGEIARSHLRRGRQLRSINRHFSEPGTTRQEQSPLVGEWSTFVVKSRITDFVRAISRNEVWLMNDHGPTTKLVKPLRSGQITIPVEFRKRLGITEESVLELSIAANELRVRVVEVRRPESGSQWLKDLYALYAPLREEATARGYSSDEIDATIDAAVAAVRDEHA